MCDKGLQDGLWHSQLVLQTRPVLALGQLEHSRMWDRALCPKPHTAALCRLSLGHPHGTGLGYPLVSVAPGPAEGTGTGTGLSPLTNTDSSNDWGGNDRQGDPTSNGQVPLVLGGFLPLVPAVDLMEEKAPGENSRHPKDMKEWFYSLASCMNP